MHLVLLTLLFAGSTYGKALTNLIEGMEEGLESSLKGIRTEEHRDAAFRHQAKIYIMKLNNTVTTLKTKNDMMEQTLVELMNSTKMMQKELNEWKEMFQVRGNIVSSQLSSHSQITDSEKFISDGDPRTHAATEWEFVPWYKAELGVNFRRITLYIDGFSYSVGDMFTVYATTLGDDEPTKICGSYTPVQYEYYTQTIVCPSNGTGFMISAYDKTGVKTILELYEIKVGVII